jgi:acid phosphatase class B
VSKNHSFETGRNKRPKKTVLMDLDGTVADTEDYEALHKIKSEEFARVARNALPNAHMVSLMEEAKQQGHNVVILTARSAHYRDDTKKWLHKHGIPYDALYMRPIDNTVGDKKLKKTVLKDEILPNYNVTKAYDDKKKNVKMFRKQGIDAERVKQ